MEALGFSKLERKVERWFGNAVANGWSESITISVSGGSFVSISTERQGRGSVLVLDVRADGSCDAKI